MGKVDARAQNLDKFLGVSFPDTLLEGLSAHPLAGFAVVDAVVAVVDHLVGDFDEQLGHSGRTLVVAGDGVDHFNGVHEGGKGLNDLLGGASLERLDKLLEGDQVLDVVFGLVEFLGEVALQLAVAGVEAGGSVFSLLLVLIADGVLHLAEVFGALVELVEEGEVLEALAPEDELSLGAVFVAARTLLYLYDGLHLLEPSAKQVLVEFLLVVVEAGPLVLLLIDLVAVVGAAEGLEAAAHLVHELGVGAQEIFALVLVTLSPLAVVHVADEGLEYLAHHDLHLLEGLLVDFSEQHLVVHNLRLDVFVSNSHKVDTLSVQLLDLPAGQEQFAVVCGPVVVVVVYDGDMLVVHH